MHMSTCIACITIAATFAACGGESEAERKISSAGKEWPDKIKLHRFEEPLLPNACGGGSISISGISDTTTVGQLKAAIAATYPHPVTCQSIGFLQPRHRLLPGGNRYLMRLKDRDGVREAMARHDNPELYVMIHHASTDHDKSA